MKANFFNLNARDFTKGLILSSIIGVMTYLTQIAADEFSWKKLAIAVVITFCGYLVKNLFTNSDDRFAKKEQI
jgi:hypothetical protein